MHPYVTNLAARKKTRKENFLITTDALDNVNNIQILLFASNTSLNRPQLQINNINKSYQQTLQTFTPTNTS